VITSAPLPEPEPALTPAGTAGAAPSGTWPIEPLAGEPPLALLGEQRVVELPAAVAAGAHREGCAVAQPGGGTAYVLPRSVQELLDDGTLVEITGGRAANSTAVDHALPQ
jgi:hypothetical protein